jgi:hypothetical protein
MKLIEKVAEEAVNDFEGGNCGCDNCLEDVWMNGFRKAREMLLQLSLEHMDPRYIKETIEQLGEEEA